jgi:hypothetical protein
MLLLDLSLFSLLCARASALGLALLPLMRLRSVFWVLTLLSALFSMMFILNWSFLVALVLF